MELLVRGMYEEFLMSVACSKFYAYEGQESEAQNIFLYLNYMEHAELCLLAAKCCSEYLKDKNIDILIRKLQELGLNNNISCIRTMLENKTHNL